MPSIEALLEENRRELLNPSIRNRLLSMPTESKSTRVVHVRDEKSDQIFRLLVSERKAMTFLAKPNAKAPVTPPTEAVSEGTSLKVSLVKESD